MLQPPTGYWVHYSSNYIKLNWLWCDTQEVWQDDLVVPPGLKLVNLNKQDRKKTEVKSLGKWQSTAKKSQNSQCSIPATKSPSHWTFGSMYFFRENLLCPSTNFYCESMSKTACACGNNHPWSICVCFEGTTDNAWRVKMEKKIRISFALDDSFQHIKLLDIVFHDLPLPLQLTHCETRLYQFS